MTTTEDRLRAALEARAEQVRTDDLRATAAPVAGRPMQMLTVLAAVAAVLVLIAAGLLTRHLLQGNAPVPPAKQPPDTPSRLTGDIDGDGTPDRVTLEGAHLQVRLGGTSTTLILTEPDLTRLVGLAGIGTDGTAIVGSGDVPRDVSSGVHAEQAFVVRLVNGRLREVSRERQSPISRDPFDTFWIEKGQLYAAAFIPNGSSQVPVSAWTFALVGKDLRATRLGRMCWDQDAEAHPTECGPGHDFPDLQGPLPALLPPAGDIITAGQSFTDTVGGRTVTVRYLSGGGGPDAEMAHVHLSVTSAGKTYDYITPKLAPTGITTRLVQAVDGGIGIVFRQETGDGELEAVYELRDGNVSPARAARSIPFGDTFFLGFNIFRTWQGTDGTLYSGLPVDEAITQSVEPQRVWAWRLSDGRLTSHPIGIVCMPPGAPQTDGTSYRRCQP